MRDGAIFGWRALVGEMHSLGLITSRVILDYYRVFPDGVDVMVAPLGKLDQSPEQTEAALSRVEPVADLLAKNGAEFIIANSYPMVCHRGPGGDREIIARIEQVANCPATTTPTAAMLAMRALGVRKIVMCSPYAKENDKIRRFVEAEGFEVVQVYGENRSLWDIHRLPTEYSYRVFRDAVRSAPTAEALFLPGGRLRSMEILDELEHDLGVPVIGSTIATAWQALQTLKLPFPVQGYGRLLAEFPPLPASA